VSVGSQDLDFHLHMLWSYLCAVFSHLRWEVVSRCVDIGGFIDHPC
jgi:hypothetical protein